MFISTYTYTNVKLYASSMTYLASNILFHFQLIKLKAHNCLTPNNPAQIQGRRKSIENRKEKSAVATGSLWIAREVVKQIYTHKEGVFIIG